MKKTINTERIVGKIYEHALVIKQTGPKSKVPGTEYISGTMDIAVDDEGLNIVQVHYTYVTAVTSTGKPNSNYPVLKQIIESGKTWITDGPEAATKVRVDATLAVNDFYSQDNTLVSTKVNENSFTSILNSINEDDDRNTFTIDMLITKVIHKDADPENNIPEDYANLFGYIFNFRGDIFPVDFVIKHPGGMAYFEDLGATENSPVFTQVRGRINSTNIKTTRTIESAFGDDTVVTNTKKSKEWLVTSANKVPYDLGDETVLTADELTTALQNREVALAEIKKRTEEYRATKNAAPAAPKASGFAMPSSGAVATGGFHF